MDYERLLIPHYSELDSMKRIMDEGINEELFTSEECRKIFELARSYFLNTKMQKPVPVSVLTDEFQQYFKVNGYPDGENDTVAVDFLIAKLKAQYKRIQAQNAIRNAADRMLEAPDDAVAELLQELSGIQMHTTTANRQEIYAEKFEERVEQYLDRLVPESRNRDAIPLGWKEVTDETGGLRAAELAVVVGYAGVGKSWVLSKMALEAARAGKRVYYATLENPLNMTIDRMDCLLTGVPYREYERGELTTEQRKRFDEVKEEIIAFDNLMLDAPRHRNERTAIDLYSRAAFYGADVIIGDQLSHIYNPIQVKNNDPFLRMGETIIQVSDLTRSFNIASVWAAQFNRDSQRGKGKRGELHQIALSSEIERYVDFAFSISATAEMRREDKALFYVMKARRSRQDVGWIMNWHLMGQTNLEVFREWNQLDI